MVTLQAMMTIGTGARTTPRIPALGRQLLSAVALAAVVLTSLPTAAFADEWTPVGEGIDYRKITDIPSQHIYVARLERDNPAVTLETSLANRELFQGKDTVSEMARRYDQTLSAWEPAWGSRMDIKVAINGSFHDLDSGRPHSGMVQGGWYIKRYNSYEGGSGFAWSLDRTAMIGGCVNHRAEEQKVTSLRTGQSRPLDLVNSSRGKGIAVYTHHYGRRSPERGGMKVLVQMDSPLTILPYPDMVEGVVKKVYGSRVRVGIPFDHIVLGLSGDDAAWGQQNLKVGDRVGFSISVDHYRDDCESPHPGSWTEAYASLSGSFEFLQDGEIHPHGDDLGARNPAPRTAICYDREYLYFIVVDGRAEGRRGMTMQELGEFCRDRLETDWGINLDGGGSSAMWVDGEIVNRPSDGSERRVANGIMMVEIEPMERSDTFRPGDRVRTAELIDLSMGPGDVYQTPYDIHEGQEGVVQAHEHGLDGVLATGDHWWLVDFGDDSGWVREGALDLVDRPRKISLPSASEAEGTGIPGRPLHLLWSRISALFPWGSPNW